MNWPKPPTTSKPVLSFEATAAVGSATTRVGKKSKGGRAIPLVLLTVFRVLTPVKSTHYIASLISFTQTTHLFLERNIQTSVKAISMQSSGQTQFLYIITGCNASLDDLQDKSQCVISLLFSSESDQAERGSSPSSLWPTASPSSSPTPSPSTPASYSSVSPPPHTGVVGQAGKPLKPAD